MQDTRNWNNSRILFLCYTALTSWLDFVWTRVLIQIATFARNLFPVFAITLSATRHYNLNLTVLAIVSINEWKNKWSNKWSKQFSNKWQNEWTSKETNEWKNEGTNKRMNKRTNEWMHDRMKELMIELHLRMLQSAGSVVPSVAVV